MSALFFGPTPVPEAIDRIDRIRHDSDQPSVSVLAAQQLSALHAMEGRFDLSRTLADQSLRAAREFGWWLLEGSAAVFLREAARLAGDLPEAERRARDGIASMERIGEKSYLSSMACSLAQVLLDQERVEEAERYAEMARASSAEDDFASQAGWRMARARILARRGEHEHARRLADEAAAIGDATDYILDRGDIWMQVSEVRSLGGDLRGAEEAARTALELYEVKGDVVSAERARAARAELGAR
jgi:tetratricopeptide (TPR) repeat protein